MTDQLPLEDFVCSKEGHDQHPSRVGCGAFIGIQRQAKTQEDGLIAAPPKGFKEEVSSGLEKLDSVETNGGFNLVITATVPSIAPPPTAVPPSVLDRTVPPPALDRKEKMDVSPNLETYNVLVKITCKKLRFSEARELLEWMWVWELKLDVSYGTLINRCAKSGDLSGALKVFDEMCERGVSPDVRSYNILIDGFFKKCLSFLLIVGHKDNLNKLTIAIA
ncbi:hypothetical protein RHSIM_Rhsim02G0112200 [Rhododendron simsii]|uniref:Pentatricopeptide repeat-containing protein n=1 Tax=Rhododendron simsii TaxID=118357 RepID=A0A834HEV5_RHOSS|nr:hypothetical protein RHSIM_Rhsim02G0112200 [Rhododendron simsii]